VSTACTGLVRVVEKWGSKGVKGTGMGKGYFWKKYQFRGKTGAENREMAVDASGAEAPRMLVDLLPG